MLTHLALAVGLVAISAEPSSTPVTRQLPAAFQAESADGSVLTNDSGVPCADGQAGDSTYHGYDGWSNHQFYGPQNFRLHFLISPKDMHQRMTYWNKERGYYYFRPYHPVTVIKQGERAASWGGNRNNAYDNRFLDKIHSEWLADERMRKKAAVVEDLPEVSGEKADEAMPLDPTTPEEPKAEDVPSDDRPVVPPPPAPRPRTPGGANKAEPKKIVKLGGFTKP